jgi:hypothetical protein
MSRPTLCPTKNLANFLEEKKIATMDELKNALGTVVDVTIFRKLQQLRYLSSYSHRGKFYTLEGIPHFDELGLWSFQSVHFSKFGTLSRTVEALMDQSQAGWLTRELEDILHVSLKEVLLQLTRQGKISRQRSEPPFLYCSADPSKRQHQLKTRHLRELREQRIGLPLPEELPEEEIKAALVLFLCLLDEQQRRLYAGLESLKFGHGGDLKVAELLDMDVQTVARGRHQLIQGDVETQRIRKTGGGRKSVEKKRQR